MNTDFLLIQKMKQGNEDAFDVFVHKYYEEILKYCSFHCFDNEYVEDLTQETFMNFFAKLSEYHFKGKTKNYLYTIAGNLCKNYYKKKKDIPTESDALEMKAISKDNSLEYILDKVVIESAMNMLPEELHEVIILYYFQGLKLTEIANVLQISLSLVKYRLKQAKMQLEQFIRKEEGDGFRK